MSDEEAKAIQEIAKTAQKSIDAAQQLGGFFSRVLGEAFEQLGGAVADWAKVYRYKNLLRLRDSVDAIHRARALEGRAIPMLPKHALPIFEQASLEDDDRVTQMWAGLIANATDPNVRFEVRKLYVQTLSALDPVDTVVLRFLFTEHLDEQYAFLTSRRLNVEELASRVSIPYEDAVLSLSNLFRLGLILDAWDQTIDSLDRGYAGFRVNNPDSNFRLSDLGRRLMTACSAA